jgi:DNA-binding CsgD family transcriptional regulator
VADVGEDTRVEELERAAADAYLRGQDADSVELWTRAFRRRLDGGDPVAAVRCAFWLWFGLGNRGEVAAAGGWHARARRILDDLGTAAADVPERGLLLMPTALAHVRAGEFEACRRVTAEAMAIGDRTGDGDLATLARLLHGRSAIGLGHVAEGTALLDEVMVAATSGETSGAITGLAYCAVIEICHEVFDLARAHEWTAALSRWCESQPELVLFRGQCQVHRSEIMQLRGSWPDALDAAVEAGERFAAAGDEGSAGAAYYQQGQLHRLRGEAEAAEAAFREASRRGYLPQPGLALLRLAQGRPDAADAGIRRALAEKHDRVSVLRLLASHVEVLLAQGNPAAARECVAELAALAADLDRPLLHALRAHADGTVRLAEGDAAGAVGVLREAWSRWRELDIPYEGARVRVLLGRACRELGDADAAEMELDAARWVFRQLGAEPDLAALEASPDGRDGGPGGAADGDAASGLTAREVEVLRLVAAGKSNRGIAVDLFLSERTVARHVSNILRKLDLPSRSAATAYAYEHHLV